jgi:hypothetical protein
VEIRKFLVLSNKNYEEKKEIHEIRQQQFTFINNCVIVLTKSRISIHFYSPSKAFLELAFMRSFPSVTLYTLAQ